MNNSDTPRWEVICGKETVIVCAEKRPAFECRWDWEKAFRKEVQDALRVLKAKEGEMITAKYGSAAEETIDAENALFYNFNAPVSQSARHGISFKAITTDEMYTIFDTLGKQGYNNLYIYSIESIATVIDEQNEIDEFVCWTDVPIKTIRIESASHFFAAMRRSPECFLLCSSGQISGDFGLRISIQSPDKEPFNLAHLMKPMLDGIISSFHKLPENAPVEELSDQAIWLLYSPEDWKRLLLDDRNAVLPAYQYVRPYRRDSLQWSPMDERCKEARLTIEYGADHWSFSGELYEVNEGA